MHICTSFKCFGKLVGTFIVKSFYKNQDVDSRSRKKNKNRVHLILCANLIQDQLTASLTARQGFFLETVLFK